jgi:ribosome-associated protein
LAQKSIPQTGKAFSAFLARIADEKLATDIIVMDLQDIESAPAEYFVICTCDSEPQLKAVVDSVDDACVMVGIKKPRKEGYGTSHWVLLDFFDVMVHIMMKDARSLYKIEKLWNDAVFYELSDKGRLRKTK